MKKLLLILLSLLTVCSAALVGCSKDGSDEDKKSGVSGLVPDDGKGAEAVEELDISAADGELANGFIWEHNYSEITITGYQGDSNELVVPAKINGKPVTKIAANAFDGFSALRSIKIPGAVKTIEANVFSGCSSLETVVFAEGVQDINSYVFSNVCPIKELTLPESAVLTEKIVNSIVASLQQLTKLNLPDSYEGALRFAPGRTLTEVTMSEKSFENSVGQVLFSEWSVCDSIEGPWYDTLFRELEKCDFEKIPENPWLYSKTCLIEYGASLCVEDGSVYDDYALAKNIRVGVDEWDYDKYDHMITISPYTEKTDENGNSITKTYYLATQDGYSYEGGLHRTIIPTVVCLTETEGYGVPTQFDGYSYYDIEEYPEAITINGKPYKFIKGWVVTEEAEDATIS